MGPGSTSVAHVFFGEREGDVHAVYRVRTGYPGQTWQESSPTEQSSSCVFQILAKTSIRAGSDRISHATCSCPAAWPKCQLCNILERKILLTVEQTALVEDGHVGDSPCGSVVRLETGTMGFEPLVHPRNILRCFLFRKNTFDDVVLILSTIVYKGDLKMFYSRLSTLAPDKHRFQALCGSLVA